ncbi:MAG: hypothetical protein DIZ80_11535 [endosymbiont of Galathealinum brachiosum]|uniref:Outer membrane protein beta-barrel domain-containing protein n=1 Tax=endosymbiont of Galathealinum brachiosum TaxID=2200906 RepID=A0A370DDG3_9GAMM|nr:MAG: hypothetical protein DIZ80_11535 [endosymbiont of Galathealinum brachiosum]
MLSNKILSVLLYVSVFHLSTTDTALADIDEVYRLSVGTNISNYNSDITLNSSSGSFDKTISFEDDLGMTNQVNSSWISARYRVGDLHHIRFTYIPISRTSLTQSVNDIIIDDTTIKAGASISTKTKSDIIDFSYIYNFHKTPQLEIGFSAGIYWLLNNTQVLAAGEVQAEGDDEVVFKSDFSSEQKLQAPMPLIGLSVNYEIMPSWRTHASFRYLDVLVNDISGRILSLEAGTEYYFNNNWGIGVSIATFELDVEAIGIIGSTALGWSHDGVQIYATFKY